MKSRPLDQASTFQLEALVDKFSLYEVLQALCNICSAKAEHVTNNWQDQELAKKWDHAVIQIDSITEDIAAVFDEEGALP